ncbi:MAG: hypothetical protein QOF35_1658 [Actinomycetota bacterium]|nr:hypothetical protein [Actinomycetota bacterium]
MPRTVRLRAIPLLLSAAVVLPLSATLPGSASAAAPPVTVVAGRDYASATFGDPWDYSNSSDLVLDNGPTLKLNKPSMSGGMVNFTTHNGYVSPIWGGYGNEVPVEREGTRGGNALDARVFTRMHLHIYISIPGSASLSYYTCGALRAACNGHMNFGLHPGWNVVDQPIVRTGAGQAWTGSMVGVRLAIGLPSGTGAVHLDSLRLYQPVAASAVSWAASKSALWWTDSAGTINAVAGQHAGQVSYAATSADSSARVTTNVAGFAPGTSFWSVAANGAKTLVGSSAPAPLPVVDSQSAAGCGDYATRYLGHPWTFTSTRSLASRYNMTALNFTNGVLSATNAAPQRNDPHFSLPVKAPGIDGRVYHRLTFVESYDGPFGLRNAPGGGAMARILWKVPGHTLLSQSAPLVTFTGKRSITVDMAMPASKLTDPEGPASQRYPFASASRVTGLRYDPNEDPGARRWHLFSVRLAADCQASTTTTVTWHDNAYRAGSTAQLIARDATGKFYPLGTATESAGVNNFPVSVRALPRGTYKVIVFVTNTSRVTISAVASGPLVKT